MLKKIIQIGGVSLVIFLFSYYFLSLFFYELNTNFLYYIKNHEKDKINKDLVVVEIDDTTYNKLWFPLDRGDYVPFLDNLKDAQTAVIAFDILFLDAGKDAAKDVILAQKFKELGNVIIWFDIKDDVQAILPYHLFEKSVLSMGYFQPFINPNTQKVASIEPLRQLQYKGILQNFESFSFSILRAYFSYMYGSSLNTSDISLQWAYYESFWKKIPILQSELLWYRDVQEVTINYTSIEKFQKESFYNIYSGNFDASKLKDKILLIWYTAEGVKDDFFVPRFGIMKGVYIHANVINNILNQTYIVYFDKKLELLISFLFIYFIVYININYLKNRNLRWITFGSLILFVVLLFLYFILFIVSYYSSGIYLLPNYPFEFLSVLFLSFFASSVLKYMNEDKNKRLLSKALSEYVSSDIAHEILHSTWQVNLSWENKRITTFFSDIAGFTTLSEKLSPEELVAFLREYLSEMSNIIIDHKGFINKYEWDAIMALWGVFWKVENFWVREACVAALLQQKRLTELNHIWKSQGKDTFDVRMGIHTWNAIIGNIGAEWRKMEFTALWDTVNLWSRLEWVNKYYGTFICVSEDVYNATKEEFTYRFLDKIRVKWKNNALNIYELISYVWEESDLKKQMISQFNQAIESYFQRDFEQAKILFQNNAAIGDPPSSVYLDRCKIFLKQPPDSDWDGVWTMKDK